MIRFSVVLLSVLFLMPHGYAQQAGGIRGNVLDADFDAPLPAAKVSIAETGEEVTATDEGNYVFGELEPGRYTLVFSKQGYTRQVKADVVVTAGQMSDADAELSGEFTEMEEFVVQDLQVGGSSEAGLLSLRQDSSSIMDSIGAEMMSKAGSSTAASALSLVTGASVQDGKYAVIRGMGDRYTSTQINRVRLPTADKDKRAVHLDQYPAALIESMQISKAFTPDQQADASSGAINMVTKAVPDEAVLKFSAGVEYSSQATGEEKFLTYKGGGTGYFGYRDSTDPVPEEKFSPVLGAHRDAPPLNHSWKVTAGNKFDIGGGWDAGILADLSYSHKYSYYDNRVRSDISKGNTPETTTQLTPENNSIQSQSKEEVLWGGALALGLQRENHEIKGLLLYTHSAKDSVWTQYDALPSESLRPIGSWETYLYTRDVDQTINYIEQNNYTLQLQGTHTLVPLYESEVDWSVAKSMAEELEPDKRIIQMRYQDRYRVNKNTGVYTYNDSKFVSKSGGGSQGQFIERRWQSTLEDSLQGQANIKIPLKFLKSQGGFLQSGLFLDRVERDFMDRHYSVGSAAIDAKNEYDLPALNGLDPNYTRLLRPIDYKGRQDLDAFYSMANVPIMSWLEIGGGARVEKTLLTMDGISQNTDGSFSYRGKTDLNGQPVIAWLSSSDELKSKIDQKDVLPAAWINLKPYPGVALRCNWSETIARPTFKELAPSAHYEYIGDDIFTGNPNLAISSLENWDVRLEYMPSPGDVMAVSYFMKKVENPIEKTLYSGQYSEQYIYPENYPEGELHGWEIELRKSLGFMHDFFEDFTVGMNATFIESSVSYPEEIRALLNSNGVSGDDRPMEGMPDYLYNFNLTYDNRKLGTSIGIFYNFKGEILTAGNSWDGVYHPSIIEKPVETLDLTFSQRFAENWKLSLSAKNLINPAVETAYKLPNDELARSTYHKGRTFSVSIEYTF
jgi:outer membrane receptor protein involved in Fe transport